MVASVHPILLDGYWIVLGVRRQLPINNFLLDILSLNFSDDADPIVELFGVTDFAFFLSSFPWFLHLNLPSRSSHSFQALASSAAAFSSAFCDVLQEISDVVRILVRWLKA